MRKYAVPIIVLIVLIAVFAGYRETREADAPGSLERIRIATGDAEGVYYIYGEALAKLFEQHLNVTVTTIPSGGAMENIEMLRSGRADLAFVQNDIMTYAYEGTNLFATEEPFKEFYAMAGLYPETCQIVARSDIARVMDLAGKRVSIGAEGSGTELNALQILESYGMKYTDVNVDHLGFSASVIALKEGKIDAFFCTAGVPTPAITELAASGEFRLLSIGDARARTIVSQYPYYARQVISKDVYPGIEEERTVAVKAALAVSGKLSDEMVFEMMNVLFENAAEIAGAVPGVSPNRDSAAEGLPIPLHPGAHRFFFGQ